jgi:hypothetical protein
LLKHTVLQMPLLLLLRLLPLLGPAVSLPGKQ